MWVVACANGYSTDTSVDSYLFFHGEDDEDNVTGIEEYRQKDDLYDQHLKSTEFATFAGSLQNESLLVGEPELKNYDPQSGFLIREKDHSSPGSGKFIWIARLTCQSKEAREEVLELAKPLAKYVHDNEPKTLSYLFLKSLDNDKDMAVFEMYENKAALTDIHHKSEQFKKFGQALREKELVAIKNSSGYKTIGKGYLAKNGQGVNFRQ